MSTLGVVQLLDAMNQIWQLDPDREPGVVYFNGG